MDLLCSVFCGALLTKAVGKVKALGLADWIV